MEVTFGMMFQQMAGLFILLLLGYGMNRSKKLPKETEYVLAQLSTKLLLPALLFTTFLEECTQDNLIKYGVWILYGTAFQLANLLFAFFMARFLAKGKNYLECVYRYSLLFPNVAVFGIPVVLSLFGTEALFQFQLFTIPIQVFTYGWGIFWLMAEKPQKSLKNRLGHFCNPVFIAIFCGMVMGVSGLGEYLPDMITNTLQSLGNCFSAMSLILLGFVIGDYHMKELIKDPMLYVISLLRLIVIPCMFLILLRTLDAPVMIRVLTCLGYTCPCGMNTVVYAAAYDQDTRPGAGLVLISSALAVVIVPLLYATMVY